MQAALPDGRGGNFIMIVKCALCDVEFKEFLRPSQDTIIVYPHWCNEMNLSYFERVCRKCTDLIRCRQYGFECREAWDNELSAPSTKYTTLKGDWVGGHDLYVRGDR